MPLVNTCEMLNDARKNGYAVPSFNITTFDTLFSIIEAAEEERSPLIVAITPRFFKYFDINHFSSFLRSKIRESSTLIALHLDHGKTLEDVAIAINNGFSSVMIDGSSLEFDDNIQLTKEVVKLAGLKQISVEGELGKLGQGHQIVNSKDDKTNPDDAKLFIEKTGVDSLAVSIGNAHGPYKYKPEIDIERLVQIKNNVDIPLVLHGGSGTPGISKLIENGISKININADFQISYINAVEKKIKDFENEYRYIDDYLYVAREEMKKVAKKRIRMFGSNNRI